MIGYWREIVIAASLLLAGLQTVRVASEEAGHAETKAAHAQQLQSISEASTKASKAAQDAQKAAQATVAAIDNLRTQEKANALADNERRRADDLAGRGGLRIPAICPKPVDSASVPSTTTPASVATPAAEIPAAFRQHVWDTRSAIIEETQQLLALQDYARACAAGK